MSFSKLRASAVLFALLLPTSAFAQATFEQSDTADVTMQYDNGLLVAYLGFYGVARKFDNEAQVGFEYRLAANDYGVRPTVGLNINGDGAIYLYGGAYWDIAIGESDFTFSPNFVAGYHHKGKRSRLGGQLEFRTGFELSYEFENKNRVGISVNHISNAGFYKSNPGAETILVNFQMPIQ